MTIDIDGENLNHLVNCAENVLNEPNRSSSAHDLAEIFLEYVKRASSNTTSPATGAKNWKDHATYLGSDLHKK